ncbi:MAG: SDR family NAD(P)-dependent oxidoreductase [Caldilineaceae bacterium]|nr:SDR family NAD(P)-dependent oxidoreductase [Caldilineaceae bacterium]
MMTTAMVWGATGGMGQAIVQQLVKEGWTVVATTRNATAASLPTPHVIEADVTSPYEVKVAVQRVGHLVDSVELWIYCVGEIMTAPVDEMSPARWQRVLDANLTGAFTTTHYSFPLLASDAHLIYIGAVSERLCLPGMSAYAAAKSGLEAFVETLRKEQRRRRVTLLRPGAVDTPFWQNVAMRLPKNALTPQRVAARLMTIYQAQEQGVIDLLPE